MHRSGEGFLHMYLIEGTFSDIAQFAGTTVEWIIRVAHLLCDPLGNVHVFTHTTGLISSISGTERGEDQGVFWTDSGPCHVTLYDYSYEGLMTHRLTDTSVSLTVSCLG